MNLVDLEKVQANCGGDQELQRELLKMGLERITTSLAEMGTTVASQDWDGLSRSIHKLRPILCYAGIEAFNEELISLEKDSREKTGLAELPARIGIMTGKLQQARCELEQVFSELMK